MLAGKHLSFLTKDVYPVKIQEIFKEISLGDIFLTRQQHGEASHPFPASVAASLGSSFILSPQYH